MVNKFKRGDEVVAVNGDNRIVGKIDYAYADGDINISVDDTVLKIRDQNWTVTKKFVPFPTGHGAVIRYPNTVPFVKKYFTDEWISTSAYGSGESYTEEYLRATYGDNFVVLYEGYTKEDEKGQF